MARGFAWWSGTLGRFLAAAEPGLALAAGEANRYTINEVIGKGSYGVVCSALDTKTGEKVAIKRIMNVFDHVSDATRILREIKLLRLLRHPGALLTAAVVHMAGQERGYLGLQRLTRLQCVRADIVEIKHIMLPPSPREFKDIYVVFELMETDLHQVLVPHNGPAPQDRNS